MATPLTADQIHTALRAEGVHVVEHPGWRTHDRAGHGAWGPVNGVIIHHTGGTAPSDGEIVWSGRSDLPGPCAHAYLAKAGTLTLTSAGRANHAGGGDGAVLAAVVAESYGTRPPVPHEHEGSAGAVDGNARFYGLECSNLGDGKDPWPPVQYDQAVRWAAALCRAHGWSSKSVIGHKEWSDWKPDPTFDMTTFRRDVAERLGHPASWSPSATTPTPPAAPPNTTTAPTKGTTTVATTTSTEKLAANLLAIGDIGTTQTGTASGRVEHAAGYYLATLLDQARQQTALLTQIRDALAPKKG